MCVWCCENSFLSFVVRNKAAVVFTFCEVDIDTAVLGRYVSSD